ncbi:MAG: PEGA domain-containing protein [Spirochaetaceae bacterium]|nr:MAG: PEGA domain-containing protein [Spirochaetaceae bacterium]
MTRNNLIAVIFAALAMIILSPVHASDQESVFFAELIKQGNRDRQASRLEFESNVPHTEVYLNGELAGKAPLILESLTPGTYYLEIISTSPTQYLPVSGWLDVPADSEIHVDIELAQASGRIILDLPAGFDQKIMINGYGEYSPGMSLPAGRHQLRIKTFGYNDIVHQVEIIAGADHTIPLFFEAADFSIQSKITRKLIRDDDPKPLSTSELIIQASSAGEINIEMLDQEGNIVEAKNREINSSSLKIPLHIPKTDDNRQRAYTLNILDERGDTLASHEILINGNYSRSTGLLFRQANSYTAAARYVFFWAEQSLIQSYSLDYGISPKLTLALNGSIANHSDTQADAGANLRLRWIGWQFREGFFGFVTGASGSVSAAIAASPWLPQNGQNLIGLGIPIQVHADFAPLHLLLNANPEITMQDFQSPPQFKLNAMAGLRLNRMALATDFSTFQGNSNISVGLDYTFGTGLTGVNVRVFGAWRLTGTEIANPWPSPGLALMMVY